MPSFLYCLGLQAYWPVELPIHPDLYLYDPWGLLPTIAAMHQPIHPHGTQCHNN
jgi:hypothetical protein